MLRRVLHICCAGLAVSMLLSGQNVKTMWQLSVSVPLSHEERVISLDPSQHFHVVLTNVSDQPQKFWKDTCSWGYDVLSLEFSGEHGKKAIVKKKPRNWRKNFPDFWTVQPGGNLILDIYLGGDAWEGVPAADFGSKVRIRAIVDVPSEKEAKDRGVWTGHLASAPEECVLSR